MKDSKAYCSHTSGKEIAEQFQFPSTSQSVIFRSTAAAHSITLEMVITTIIGLAQSLLNQEL